KVYKGWLDSVTYNLQGADDKLALAVKISKPSIHKSDSGERNSPSLLLSLNKRCRVFSLAKIKLATHDFDDALVIGKGRFGKIYKGKFDFWEGVDVAIKRSNLDSNQGKSDARGLDYLHTGTGVESRVIYHDVKSSNVLLDEKLAAKISHFRVSRIGPTNQPALDFMLDEQQHTLAGWAKHCIKEGKISQIIDPCFRGPVSANCLKEFRQIAYECLLTSSKDRPTMTNMLSRLEFVLQSDNDKKRNGRTTFIEKARLLLSTKAPMRISFDTKRLRQNNGNNKRGKMMEKHVTTVAEI
nr:serine/threonine/dual specificity protein kinase, catalytic domain-containing protein [Tanacetum cinerariifolium]